MSCQPLALRLHTRVVKEGVMTTRLMVVGTFVVLATIYGASFAAEQRETDTPGPTITVVGCIQRTAQPDTLGITIQERTTPPETTGISANPGEPGPGFILTDATPKAPGTSTEPSAASSTDAPRRFVLFGNEGDLGKHEGQRVQVSGTIERPTKPPESGAVGTSGSSQLKSGAERLKVAAIEMIGGACSPR
jgi:hypothetical protein